MNEIDKKHLKKIENEFLTLSRIRFDRMLASLTQKQQDYLRLLPLFFHVNHPMLPGYHDSFTPCGIPNYSPTSLEKQIVKTVSQSFDYQSKAYHSFAIASLFLMGSMGTLGQSVSSDIDLWICFTDKLSDELNQKLTKKAENIKLWFAEKGIELNFYLVHKNDFSQVSSKQLGDDNCGNTQRFLLLDEFYRTAIWLVGRKPLWWVIPESENYSNFSNRLIKQKHLDDLDWIDFGEVKIIPAVEYFTATLWQLYKSIESPYKSFVKLMALEVYAKNHPCGGLLSSQLKSILHANQLNSTECDPYLLLLQFSEASLKQSPQKLEFLRRSFYLKSGLKIKLNVRYEKTKNWRYELMKGLVKQWGWSSASLERLNNRPNWKIDSVAEQRKDLIKELTSCYYALSNFARVQGVMNKSIKQELTHLGRQLYASFERRNGKVDSLNNGLAKNVTENTLTFSENDGVWSVYQEQIPRQELPINQSIYVSSSLFDCLTWGCVNKVIGANTHFHLYTDIAYFNQDYAKQTTREILKWISIEKTKHSNSNFKESAKPLSLGLFINTGVDPLLNEKNRDRYLIANNSDCLSLSSEKNNLVFSFHVLSLNSWGEIDLNYFQGNDAIPLFFKEYSDVITQLYSLEKPSFYCHGLLQNKAIVERLTSLLQDWVKLLSKSRVDKSRIYYLMSVGNQFLSVSFDNKQVDYKLSTNKEMLINSVHYIDKENLQDKKIKVHLDPFLPLRAIEELVLLRRSNKNHQCFISEGKHQTIEVLFKSNLGAIHARKHEKSSLKQIIAHYQQFFMKAENRIGDLKTLEVDYFRCEIADVDNESIRTFKSQDKKQLPAVKLLPLKNVHSNMHNFNLIQAIKMTNNSSPLAFNFHSSEKDYLFGIDKEGIYTKLAQDILKRRKTKEQYPIYITDLDLGKERHQVNIVELLNVKRDLENRLNLILSKINQS
ncbi:MAG: hypothetical protein COA86_01490 [Kangiella sp.]|nr:MAG: hypothetical protein COA86_01490 [Kangiella sp.]